MGLDEALQQYGALVIHLAWRITRDQEETRDICQEVFLKLHTAWTNGQQIAQLKAWLSTTTLHAALNSKRRRSRLVPLSETVLPVCAEGELAQVDRQLLLDQVHQLVLLLPERQQQVFVLRHFQGLPFEEISQELGCSPLAARSATFQALRKMRAWLTGEATPVTPTDATMRKSDAVQE